MHTLNSNGIFQELVCEIYPSRLILNKENLNDNEADILDLNISLKDGKFILYLQCLWQGLILSRSVDSSF